jgi:pantetheine-phosphate adenylyltransferase
MLIDLYRRLGASCVVKGLRNERDYLYEEKQALWNREHYEGFETLYFAADDDLAAVSSTEVRRRLSEGLDCADLLMPNAEKMILSGEFLKHGKTE